MVNSRAAFAKGETAQLSMQGCSHCLGRALGLGVITTMSPLCHSFASLKRFLSLKQIAYFMPPQERVRGQAGGRQGTRSPRKGRQGPPSPPRPRPTFQPNVIVPRTLRTAGASEATLTTSEEDTARSKRWGARPRGAPEGLQMPRCEMVTREVKAWGVGDAVALLMQNVILPRVARLRVGGCRPRNNALAERLSALFDLSKRPLS